MAIPKKLFPKCRSQAQTAITAEEISARIGEPSEKLEKIFIYKNVIFWSFDRKNYAKANWWKKTASAGIGEFLTIRTANTVRKIAELCG